MVMTREEKAYELMLEEARARVKELEKGCPHAVDDGKCEVCKTYFGWGCSESPDRVCHYEARKAQGIHVRDWLWTDISGKKHVVPQEKVEKYIRPEHLRDQLYYSDEDCCIFCGHPSERK